MNKAFITWEEQYKRLGFNSQRRYPNEGLIQFLAKHYFCFPLKVRKKIRVLELGCGSGANLWMVAKEGFDTYGIDTSPTALRLCRKMLTSYGVKAKLKLCNMQNLEFDDEIFDVIFDVASIQHTDLESHRKTYKEIYRCLRGGGRFFSWHLGERSISFINGGGKLVDKLTIDNIQNRDMPLANNGTTCFLNPSEAKEMLSTVGFKDIEIEIITRTYKNMTQSIEYFWISAYKP